jgi:hypothetical protein
MFYFFNQKEYTTKTVILKIIYKVYERPNKSIPKYEYKAKVKNLKLKNSLKMYHSE